MSLNVGVGTSRHRNPERAGAEAAKAALEQAGIDKPDWVLMYATVGYDQKTLLKAVRETTSHAPLSGCSGEGIIAQGVIDESSHAVTVLVWKSDRLKWKNVIATGLSKGARAVGAEVAAKLGQVGDDARLMLVLADAVTYSHDLFLEGIRTGALADKWIPMVGGSAADALTQGLFGEIRTYQYFNDEVHTDGVSVSLLSGEGEIVTDVTHGCVPIGTKPHTITRCEDDIIYEIDGKPARDLLEEYLAADSMREYRLDLSSLQIGFEAPTEVAAEYDPFYIRTTIPGPTDPKSIRVFTSVEKGQKLWMTRRDAEKILAGVDRLAGRLKKRLTGEPKAILHIECLSRGRNMWTEEERTHFQEQLLQIAPGVPWIGFYSLGEIAPIGEQNHFHNFTSVLTAVR